MAFFSKLRGVITYYILLCEKYLKNSLRLVIFSLETSPELHQ